MKKIISMALILCIVLSACITVNAASTTVSRGLLASMLAESSNYSEEAKGNAMFSVFSDVGKTTTYAQQIYIASRQGWMLGYTDGSFRPNNSIKLEELCCAVYKFLGNNSKNLKGSFPEAYIETATSKGWLDGTTLKQGDLVTLTDCELVLHNAGIGDYKTQGSYVGLIKSVSKASDSEDGTVKGVYTIYCVDGSTKTFNSQSLTEYSTGTLVRVDVTNAKTTVTQLREKSISGTVNTKVTSIGTQKISANIKVIETDSYGNFTTVDPEILSGRTLSESNVRYYSLDGANEIDTLILNDCTGNLSSYGIFVSESVQEGSAGTQNQASTSTKYTYTFIDNGKQTTQTGNIGYVVDTGCIEYRTSGNTLKLMRQLGKTTLNSVTETTASADYKTYKVSDNVQVYVKSGSTYYLSSISALLNSNYTHFEGYYDTKGFGLIRVIIAY